MSVEAEAVFKLVQYTIMFVQYARFWISESVIFIKIEKTKPRHFS